MGYGLLIRNSATKTIMIDGIAPNYILTAKGTVNTSNPGPGLDFTSVTVFLTGAKAPVVAVACTAGCYGIIYSPSGGNTQVQLVARGTIGTPISYWVFDDPDTVPPPTGWGLVIRNPVTKKVVFATGQKPMRVIDFVTYAKGSASFPPYAAGRVYAVVCVGIAGSGMWHPDGPGYQSGTYTEDRQAVAINANVLSVVSGGQAEQPLQNSSLAPPHFNRSAQALVLDVTGL